MTAAGEQVALLGKHALKLIVHAVERPAKGRGLGHFVLLAKLFDPHQATRAAIQTLSCTLAKIENEHQRCATKPAQGNALGKLSNYDQALVKGGTKRKIG